MEYDVGRRTNRPLAMMLTLCGALAIITLVSAGRAQEKDNVRSAPRPRVAQDLRVVEPSTPRYADTARTSLPSAHPTALPPGVSPHGHSFHGRQVTNVVPLPPDLLPLPLDVTRSPICLARRPSRRWRKVTAASRATRAWSICTTTSTRCGWAASIVMAAIRAPASKENAHVQPRFPEVWATSGESSSHLRALELRVAGVHSLREPRRSARGACQLRRLPSAGSAARQEEHDDPRVRCCGARRSTTTARCRPRTRSTAKATARAACRSDCKPCRRRRRTKWSTRAWCRISIPCRGSRFRSRATCFASLSVAAGSDPRWGFPSAPKNRADRARD